MPQITLVEKTAEIAGKYLPEVTAEFAERDGVQGVALFIPLPEEDEILKVMRNRSEKSGGGEYLSKLILGRTHNGKNKPDSIELPALFNGNPLNVRAELFSPVAEDESESGS